MELDKKLSQLMYCPLPTQGKYIAYTFVHNMKIYMKQLDSVMGFQRGR